MEDINDFLKDQSKNTLQDYYEKLKTGGNEYANLYLEEITIAIIEHKNEKDKKNKKDKRKKKKPLKLLIL